MNKNNFIYLSIFLLVIFGGILLLKETSNTINTNQLLTVSQDSDDTITNIDWDNNGIFKKYYTLANSKLDTLTLDEKIGQLLLVKYPSNSAIDLLKKYNFAGYIFYENDFINKTKYEVNKMIEELQNNSKIPILTAVDEEGGDIVRISNNSNLVDNKFLSPSELYNTGGFDLIKEDTIKKSNILSSLGINLNLAPVVDVATDTNSYIYNRTLKQNTELTSTYAKTVIENSKNSGVSFTLKHFPGYGNNSDTHLGVSIDNRSYDDIYDNDLPPFKAGIEAGGDSILISHNIVTAIDDAKPASLSKDINNLLRNELKFSGITITDNLEMSALDNFNSPVIDALLAGNDLMIVSNYQNSFNQIKDAINDGTITEDLINNRASRIIAWKYYKGLMYENQK